MNKNRLGRTTFFFVQRRRLDCPAVHMPYQQHNSLHSFIHSFIHCVRSFIHSFIHCVCWFVLVGLLTWIVSHEINESGEKGHEPETIGHVLETVENRRRRSIERIVPHFGQTKSPPPNTKHHHQHYETGARNGMESIECSAATLRVDGWMHVCV